MKKIISAIVSVAMLVALSTSVFAYTAEDAVVTGATLSGKTITYDPANKDGFTFAIVCTADVSLASGQIKLGNLENAGWTISQVDGAWSEGNATSGYINQVVSGGFSYSASGNNAEGKKMLKFKAVPGNDATIDGVTFTVGVASRKLDDTMHNTLVYPLTYTIKAAADNKVKAETQTNGSVKVTYPEGYTGNKNLDGKYIVFKNVVLQGTEVTADTRFDIEYNGTKKRFGATLFETLGVVGQGSLNAGTYGFGVAFDSDVNASDVTITKVNETVNE